MLEKQLRRVHHYGENASTPSLRHVEGHELNQLSHLVESCENGQVALDLLLAPNSAHRFDVVATDVEMPVMSGLEFTRRVRELEKSGELPGRQPIVSISGNAREGQTQTALEAGGGPSFCVPIWYQTCSLFLSLVSQSTKPSPNPTRSRTSW